MPSGFFDDLVPGKVAAKPAARRAPTAVEGRRLQNASTAESIQSANMNQAATAQDLLKAPIDRARAAQALKVDQATAPSQIIKTEADALKAQIELEHLQKQRGYLTPTEQQSLAAARAILMIEGEKTYKRGLERGYRPNAFGNKVTAMLDKVPLVGKEAATLLRSPAAELAIQGESTYRQGSLRSLTGSAGPVSEKVDVQEIAFPSPFQSGDRELSQRIAATRAKQIAGMRAAAGPMLAEAYKGEVLRKPSAGEIAAYARIPAANKRAARQKLEAAGVDISGLR